MDILTIRRTLLAQGFTHFQTMAGWRRIQEFDPYGLAPASEEFGTAAGKNWRETYTPYAGEIIEHVDDSSPQTVVQTYVRDLPTGTLSAPFMLGGFPVSTGRPYQIHVVTDEDSGGAAGWTEFTREIHATSLSEALAICERQDAGRVTAQYGVTDADLDEARRDGLRLTDDGFLMDALEEA